MSLFRFFPLRAAVAVAPREWSFENGLADWTTDSAGWNFGPGGATAGLSPFHGNLYATYDAFVTGALSGTSYTNDTFTAAPGQVWTVNGRVGLQPNKGAVRGRVGLQWLDAANALLSTSWGDWIDNQQAGWQLAISTATAPASTAKVRVAIGAENDDATYKTGRIAFDYLTLNG